MTTSTAYQSTNCFAGLFITPVQSLRHEEAREWSSEPSRECLRAALSVTASGTSAWIIFEVKHKVQQCLLLLLMTEFHINERFNRYHLAGTGKTRVFHHEDLLAPC